MEELPPTPTPSDYYTAAESAFASENNSNRGSSSRASSATNSPLAFGTPPSDWANGLPHTNEVEEDRHEEDTTPRVHRVSAGVSSRLQELQAGDYVEDGEDGEEAGGVAAILPITPAGSRSATRPRVGDSAAVHKSIIYPSHNSSSSSMPHTRRTANTSSTTTPLTNSQPSKTARPATSPQDLAPTTKVHEPAQIQQVGEQEGPQQETKPTRGPQRRGRRKYKNQQLKLLPADHPKRKAMRARRKRTRGRRGGEADSANIPAPASNGTDGALQGSAEAKKESGSKIDFAQTKLMDVRPFAAVGRARRK